jgi:hypothetical protein
MSLDERPCDAATKRRRARLLRRTAQTLSMVEDRAFFMEQAVILDQQAAELERKAGSRPEQVRCGSKRYCRDF